MEEMLVRFNGHWGDESWESRGIVRKKYLQKILEKLKRKEIVFLTGMRRVGKTTLIRQTIHHLIREEKVPPRKILFVSCDDIVLSGKSLFDIIGVYREINRVRHSESFYLFVDEVNYMKDFHQQLKNIYDSWNLKVMCSSSNASHLNDKKAFLTGRTATVEVYPLDYEEFLKFKKIKIEKHDKSLNKRYFEEYLKHGGMPQYTLDPDPERLLEIVNSIIQKDLISYYKIKDEKSIKELFKILCRRIGTPVSYNKIAGILKIEPETVKKYIHYFEKTYLFFSCERYSKSGNETVTSPKKYYILDNGLKNLAIPFQKGRSFENLVFIRLHEKKSPLQSINYYFRDSAEIDFITDRYLIEAKYGNAQLTPKQKQAFSRIRRKTKKVVRNYWELLKVLGETGHG